MNKINNTNAIHIYVDGSWSKQYRQVGSGIIIIGPTKETLLTIQLTSHTNTKAQGLYGEIQAVKIGLSSLPLLEPGLRKKYKNIVIYHDFDNLDPNTITKIKNHHMQSYHDWLKSFKTSHPDLNIIFQKVKAHSTNKYNNFVDNLAYKAANTKPLKK